MLRLPGAIHAQICGDLDLVSWSRIQCTSHRFKQSACLVNATPKSISCRGVEMVKPFREINKNRMAKAEAQAWYDTFAEELSDFQIRSPSRLLMDEISVSVTHPLFGMRSVHSLDLRHLKIEQDHMACIVQNMPLLVSLRLSAHMLGSPARRWFVRLPRLEILCLYKASYTFSDCDDLSCLLSLKELVIPLSPEFDTAIKVCEEKKLHMVPMGLRKLRLCRRSCGPCSSHWTSLIPQLPNLSTLSVEFCKVCRHRDPLDGLAHIPNVRCTGFVPDNLQACLDMETVHCGGSDIMPPMNFNPDVLRHLRFEVNQSAWLTMLPIHYVENVRSGILSFKRLQTVEFLNFNYAISSTWVSIMTDAFQDLRVLRLRGSPLQNTLGRQHEFRGSRSTFFSGLAKLQHLHTLDLAYSVGLDHFTFPTLPKLKHCNLYSTALSAQVVAQAFPNLETLVAPHWESMFRGFVHTKSAAVIAGLSSLTLLQLSIDEPPSSKIIQLIVNERRKLYGQTTHKQPLTIELAWCCDMLNMNDPLTSIQPYERGLSSECTCPTKIHDPHHLFQTRHMCLAFILFSVLVFFLKTYFS